ncbi:peroxiredoxin family protein [Phorcysia thermohydrogeniphila]|uniref:Peroxiredoxin n=1 Tax=Phorcysia thermohydrogeniphila TaxID=936138 RepID=A0A4V2PD62_9BACT|nr:redoxin domain-containing protein [Phorcysia thermohydrogeniphila]TCK03976.1 peroxiredoxin [Phorcysia thermohydrogeniphila]
MGILKASLLITLLLSSTALADWYILIPKKPPARREKPRNVPLPQLKPNKIEAKPYRIEVRKILSPDFAIRTLELKKITKKDLEGRKVVIVFLKNLYSPLSELLLSTLQEIAKKEKNLVILAVDINDADFPILRKFKESMGLKDIVVTADSYVYIEFKERLKVLNVPSLVVIDKYGFIRFFANEIEEEKITSASKELEKILKSLG